MKKLFFTLLFAIFLFIPLTVYATENTEEWDLSGITHRASDTQIQNFLEEHAKYNRYGLILEFEDGTSSLQTFVSSKPLTFAFIERSTTNQVTVNREEAGLTYYMNSSGGESTIASSRTFSGTRDNDLVGYRLAPEVNHSFITHPFDLSGVTYTPDENLTCPFYI